MARSKDSERQPLTTSRRDALKLAGAATVGGVAATLASGRPAAADTPATTASQTFAVEIDGIEYRNIQLQLIDSSSDVKLALKPSGSAIATPGGLDSQTIVLQQPWTYSGLSWLNWRTLVLKGKPAAYRKTIVVILYNDELVPVERFTFSNAWPASYVGPTLGGSSPDLVETITCVYEDLVVKVA